MSLVTVYSKPGCQPCRGVIRKLTKAGFPPDVIDITEDREAYDFVVGLGYQSTPVVVSGEQHFSEMRDSTLDKLIEELRVETANLATVGV